MECIQRVKYIIFYSASFACQCDILGEILLCCGLCHVNVDSYLGMMAYAYNLRPEEVETHRPKPMRDFTSTKKIKVDSTRDITCKVDLWPLQGCTHMCMYS